VYPGSGLLTDTDAAQMLRANPGFFQASLSDPFEATHQTVQYMVGLIGESLKDPIINRAAADACKRFWLLTGSASSDAKRKAECAWWWAKHAVKFVHHQKLLEAWLGKSDELQLLIAPDVLLKMQQPKGDCAVFTCLVCALLECLQVPWEICTVAVNPRQPEIFSHVYARAVMPNGVCIPLDASHGKYPGWEVPASRVTLKQIWNSAGEPIQDRDPGFRGLHDMDFSSGGGSDWGLGSLGCDCEDIDPDTGECLDPSPCVTTGPTTAGLTLCSDGSYQTVCPPLTGPQSGSTITPPSVTVPSSSSSSSSSNNNALDAALVNFGAAWTKIAGQVIAPQVTQTGANGASITGPAAALQSILTGNVNLGGTSTSMVTLLLLAGGAFLVISMMGKK